MINIQKLRRREPQIIALGSYPDIIQSILDFDFLCQKNSPSIKGIIAGGRKFERYFWGKEEILLPVSRRLQDIPEKTKNNINLFLNLTSGRRTFSSTKSLLDFCPNISGGSVFAENVPEKFSLELYEKIKYSDKFIVGPASVGLLIPCKLKLGAIGGTQPRQIIANHLLEPGNIASFSASGGMTNEIINIITQNDKRLSFSLSFGGDRFPILTPQEAFLAAQDDPETSHIVYFGELGGYDEYEIAEAIKNKQITKPVITYIAGSISEMFETPPQFGHAKAMAGKKEETAKAKREALKNSGAKVAQSFSEFIQLIKQIPNSTNGLKTSRKKSKDDTLVLDMEKRKHTLFVNTISEEKDGAVSILDEPLTSLANKHSFAFIVVSLLLGRKIKSKELEKFADFILKLLVDHGPNVSGVVNTMITARAGKDLVSSLAAGLLTIGPRFGGAINAAAVNWLAGVDKDPFSFVESFAKHGEYIAGIGHKKYTVENPDPRVKEILQFTKNLKSTYSNFAKKVEKITTAKKGNLILNVDGAIGAVMLDLLSEKENLSERELKELTDTEFFNAFFVLSRSVGFTAHFMDQKRIDEGLFRLPQETVTTIKR